MRNSRRAHLALNATSGMTHARKEGDAIDHQYHRCGAYRRPSAPMPVAARVFASLQILPGWQMCAKCARILAAEVTAEAVAHDDQPSAQVVA